MGSSRQWGPPDVLVQAGEVRACVCACMRERERESKRECERVLERLKQARGSPTQKLQNYTICPFTDRGLMSVCMREREREGKGHTDRKGGRERQTHRHEAIE